MPLRAHYKLPAHRGALIYGGRAKREYFPAMSNKLREPEKSLRRIVSRGAFSGWQRHAGSLPMVIFVHRQLSARPLALPLPPVASPNALSLLSLQTEMDFVLRLEMLCLAAGNVRFPPQ